MSSAFSSDIRELLILAVVLSVLLAQDKSEQEISKMGAFFTIMGDVLDLFALQPDLFQRCKRLCGSGPDSQTDSSADTPPADA